MRILHIIDNLAFGGAQTLLRGLFENGDDSDSLFLFAIRRKQTRVNINHENIIMSDATAKFSLSPLRKLRKLIQLNDIAIVHCHLFRAQVFGYLLKKFWYPDIKLVFHEHGGIFEDGIFYRLFMRLSQSKVNVFIAVSNAMKEGLIDRSNISPSKIVVLYNFVDLKKFDRGTITWDVTLERQKIGIQKDAFVVGFAGRLIERKGWREFILAAFTALRKDTELQFVLAGDGPDSGALEMFHQTIPFSKNITLLGYVSDMVRFYSMLDCFVMPSHWEGLPMAQLEVLAMGIPLISNDAPGLNEIPQEDNKEVIFVKTNDPDDLSKKILEIKFDVELRKTMAVNEVKLASLHSLPLYIRRLKQIYEQI